MKASLVVKHYAFGFLGGALMLACNRYEMRPVPCPVETPNGGSTIAWERVSGTVGSLTLALRSISGDTTLLRTGPQARIGNQGWRVFGPDGIIRFDSLALGPQEVSVRVLGYRAAHTTVVMPDDGAVRAAATVALYPLSFDGGCGMMYRARKPWWKLW
jgi:hypothetical protein